MINAQRAWRLSTSLTAMLVSVCAVFAAGRAGSAEPVGTTPLVVADGVWLIAGGTREDRQPDGNISESRHGFTGTCKLAGRDSKHTA